MPESNLCRRLCKHRYPSITPVDVLLIGALTMLMILSASTIGVLLFFS